MKKYIEEILINAAAKLNYPVKHFATEIPKDEKFGDFSANIAMTLAKDLKMPPRKIAEEIIANLEYNKNYILKTEIAGAGFINFYATNAYYIDELKKVLAEKDNFGKSDKNKGKTVNLEWVSANPTKPLHAGHGRQICLGKAMASLLECTGYKVIREYYYNDAGNQMHTLALSVKARYEQIFDSHYPFPENGYKGDYIKEIAKQIFDKVGEQFKGKDELEYFRSVAEKYNFGLIRHTLESLGINHDIFFNESSLYANGAVKNLLEEFKEKGFSYEKEGAVWLKSEGKEEHQKDKVIVKATGEPTYRLPDMAYHIDKIKRGYDFIIDIFGADHSETYREVLWGLKLLGYDVNKIKVILHQMVVFKVGEEAVKMSGRFGTFYFLDDLIQDIGKDATQFFFIMRSPGSHLEFDIDLAKEQSDKNPVYYLQYAHARICGILRNAEEIYPEYINKDFTKLNLNLLQEKSEIDLIKILSIFPEEVELSAISFEPHKIITYLNRVAEHFHRFYRNDRVLLKDNPKLSHARLQLCLATKQVLKNGFGIIGISAPERMERAQE